MPNTVRVSREQLYEELWEETMDHVAKRYGITAAALANACDRFAIPRPRAGYWVQRAHGKAVTRPPLPQADDAGAFVYFGAWDRRPSQSEEDDYRREKDPAWKVTITEANSPTHPLVKQTARALEQASKEEPSQRYQDRPRRELLTARAGPFAVSVSRAQRSRALLVLDAFAHACDRRGWSLEAGTSGHVRVRVQGQLIAVRLRESVRQIRKSAPWGSWEVDYEPTGLLHLTLEHGNAGIHDTPVRRIEDHLNGFLRRLVREAINQAAAQRALQDRERSWRMHDDEQRRQVQVLRTATLRRQRLRQLALQWRRQHATAGLVAAVEDWLGQGHGDAERRHTLTAWVQWARAELASMDPIAALAVEPFPEAEMPAPSPMPWGWQPASTFE